MKYILAAILLVLYLVIQDNQAAQSNEWLQFKLVHNKLYETKDEEAQRFSIWQANKKLIELHNLKFEQGLVTYSLNMNKFGDMVIKIIKINENACELCLLFNVLYNI